MSTRLSVNINKVALLRNSRGGNLPNLLQVALDCEDFGAQGITVHPRPDERHIRYADIPVLKEAVRTEFNIEGYPSERFTEMVLAHQPHQVTLVPDPPGVLTSNTGWNTEQEGAFLQDVVARFRQAGIRVSIFLNAQPELIASAKATGTDRIELYTGDFARQFEDDPALAVAAHTETAVEAELAGLGVNAGHDLNLFNLAYYRAHVPPLLEVSIGHALIADALYYGLKNTIQRYLYCLQPNMGHTTD